MQDAGWKLVIHGGSGLIQPSKITPEQDLKVRAALDQALSVSSDILGSGGSAVAAVEAAVRELEDDPSFNAGRGAVFDFQGGHSLDAAMMDGRDRSAGAVSAVTRTRNPVSLARAVMERSVHVFLSGPGADQYSRDEGLEQVEPGWFSTAERRGQLDEIKQAKGGQFDIDIKYGTVGAVALDLLGNVAAATSTGGLTGKRWGRIGDSPLIGAGTYADNRSAAVSATGAGEYFIRAIAAHQLAERVRLGGQPLRQAIEDTLADVDSLGGKGGLIAVTASGEVAWGFTTAGMYRGQASASGRRIRLYSEAEER